MLAVQRLHCCTIRIADRLSDFLISEISIKLRKWDALPEDSGTVASHLSYHMIFSCFSSDFGRGAEVSKTHLSADL